MRFEKQMVYLGHREEVMRDRQTGQPSGCWYPVSLFDVDAQSPVELSAGAGRDPELMLGLQHAADRARKTFGVMCNVTIDLQRDSQKGWRPRIVGLSPVE